MNREYDLFEELPDGSLLWRAVAQGLENALAKLKELGSLSPNEHFAMHTPTKMVVGRVNVPRSDAAGFRDGERF
jgi:hypothetical protein